MHDEQQGELKVREIENMLETPINGIDELNNWLHETLQTKNTAHETDEIYRLFKLGDAESIIRLHAANHPEEIKIWFYDLFGRAAPEIVKKTIASFFKNTFQLEPAPFFDLYQKAKTLIVANTFIINNELLPMDKRHHAIKKLMQESIDSQENNLFEKDLLQKNTNNKLGLFQSNKHAQATEQDLSETKPKTPLKTNT